MLHSKLQYDINQYYKCKSKQYFRKMQIFLILFYKHAKIYAFLLIQKRSNYAPRVSKRRLSMKRQTLFS